MLERRAGSRGSRGRAGEAVLSTWTRTLMAAVVIIVIFGIVAGLAVSGRLGDLRYANIPVVHPWPPAGYYQNPFNPADKGDLVNAREAATVKAALLADGQVELQAVRSGDVGLLVGADAGNRLATLNQIIQTDNAQGQYATESTQYSAIVVGHLADPNAPSLTWCVEERGTSTIRYLLRSTGAVVRTESFRLVDKFWVVLSNGRYLITDAQIQNQPLPGGA